MDVEINLELDEIDVGKKDSKPKKQA